ncbi:MAG: M23 family metallopeptidase [Gemmatimonadota bacterium]
MTVRRIHAPIAIVALIAAAFIASALARRQDDGRGVATSAIAPCASTMVMSWEPERPVPGTLFILRVRSVESGAAPQGRIGSEPLHFALDSAGSWHTLAPVSIDDVTQVSVILTCAGEAADSAMHVIPLATASYPLERLRVAPRFSAKPDSALLARQRREAERAAAVSARSHETPRLWSAPFQRPRDTRVTSVYGSGREFNGTVTSRHMGTDFAGAVGAPVRAANRGVVRLVDRFFLGGNVVYLDHGEGLVTVYLHLSKHRVAEGDTVERGQIVGEVGATGRVTGPHLHWIARYGAVSVDPLSLLHATAPQDGAAPSPS